MDKEDYHPYEDVSQISIFKKMVVDYPMLPIGVAGFLGLVGHGIYNFKNRTLKPSLYLIQYRVASQGAFVGCLTLGLVYVVFKRHIWDKKNKDKNER